MGKGKGMDGYVKNWGHLCNRFTTEVSKKCILWLHKVKEDARVNEIGEVRGEKQRKFDWYSLNLSKLLTLCTALYICSLCMFGNFPWQNWKYAWSVFLSIKVSVCIHYIKTIVTFTLIFPVVSQFVLSFFNIVVPNSFTLIVVSSWTDTFLEHFCEA